MGQRANEERRGTALRWTRLGTLRRVAGLVCMAVGVSVAFSVSGRRLQSGERVGFGWGLLNGAMMPAAFPSLLLGKDVVIYAPNNTGIPYKLGYTAGVNLCGLIFFGMAFYRPKRAVN